MSRKKVTAVSKKKPHLHLNCFLAKAHVSAGDFSSLLVADAPVTPYSLTPGAELNGTLYVKEQKERVPSWYGAVRAFVGVDIESLQNKSSSAVLIFEASGRVFAVTFGYGRFLLNDHMFEPDFGIKTALNTLESESLRTVDVFTLDGDSLQKKTQAPRSAAVASFGIDVSRDVLRGITGKPKQSTEFTTVAGGDSMFSFSMPMDPNDLSGIAADLLRFYGLSDYRAQFSWVDNVRRVQDQVAINKYDDLLVQALKAGVASGVSVVPPEILKWEDIESFSFTRNKGDLRPVLETEAYLKTLDCATLTIERVKQDRLFIYDRDGRENSYSVYKCIYIEIADAGKSVVLFGGKWYEVDSTFMGQIDSVLSSIPTCQLSFPRVYFWDDAAGKQKIEAEGEYNARACQGGNYYLLDRKLIKSGRTTSPIEFCDLLTVDKKLIHVKHRKGRSAGLSHLFAQGAVSAEVLLGDRDFRKRARAKLRQVDPALADIVPLGKVQSSEFEVVFLILDDDAADVKAGLPFFSKVNLVRTFEGLSQRGFSVSVAGVGRESKP